ncbi:ABC transporter ATP-binding protein [Nocardia sp. NPDC056000]|uniref:ABC transporter ATP-binding protein n=1 Tax=Nocardia sp. NPDC056000 TaxID=3345674 RepID=UPI0035D73087
MIKLRDVVREYRLGGELVRALDGVSLDLDLGEFTAVVGPSGAGKSTLLHIVGALDAPTSGSVEFDGAEIAGLTEDQRSRFRLRSVGFIFQFFNLLPTMSAWENVALPRVLDGSPIGRVRKDALALLDLVGIGDRAEHRPTELSGGQMQRVAIARALMLDAPLILADEPTGNLDSKSGQLILELLTSLAHDTDRPRMVVMVTHDKDAAATADRTIEMVDGKVRTP